VSKVPLDTLQHKHQLWADQSHNILPRASHCEIPNPFVWSRYTKMMLFRLNSRFGSKDPLKPNPNRANPTNPRPTNLKPNPTSSNSNPNLGIADPGNTGMVPNSTSENVWWVGFARLSGRAYRKHHLNDDGLKSLLDKSSERQDSKRQSHQL